MRSMTRSFACIDKDSKQSLSNLSWRITKQKTRNKAYHVNFFLLTSKSDVILPGELFKLTNISPMIVLPELKRSWKKIL